MTVLNHDVRNEITNTYRQTIRTRRSSRTASLESIGDAFSHQFSHLINLARQGHEADIDSTVVRQQASYNSTPSQSQRWHASDDESGEPIYVDSVFGEIESNISFGDYGGDSDTSIYQHSTMGREIAIQLDNDSYVNTNSDTDIDPMNAGIDHWDSDDQEDARLEDSRFDEAVDTMPMQQQQSHDIHLSGLSEEESNDALWSWSMSVSQRANRANLMEDIEGPETRIAFVGNPGDYVDARQFEMLLEQFADDNISRRGAPPTATSFTENLPSVIISTSHQTNGDVICPICKDLIPIRSRAKQLPCMHLYHTSCILPWLSSRNTCSVCRYELPTDVEYERSRQATTNQRDVQVVEHAGLPGTVEYISDDAEVEETNTSENSVHVAEQPNRTHRRSGWLFIAAAPVVSLVSLALALCFTNSARRGRRQLYCRSQNDTVAHVDTKRNWWPMF